MNVVCDRQVRVGRVPTVGAGLVALALATAWLPAGQRAAAETGGADAELLAYGEYLSGECVTCHRVDGLDEAIPAIAGMPADAIVAALNAYRNGARTNPAMTSAARALDDGQVEALSLYFSSLNQP